MAADVQDTLFGPAAAAYWRTMDPAERQAAIRTFERLYRQAGDVYLRPSIAVIGGLLPDGAAAIVMRGASPGEPLIVLSYDSAHLETLNAADVAVRADIMCDAESSEMRVLYVLPDGHVSARVDDTVQVRLIDVPADLPPAPQLVSELTELALAVSGIDISGVSTGIVLRFH